MTTDMSMTGLFIRNSFTNIKFDLVIEGIFPAYFLKIVVFKIQKGNKKEICACCFTSKGSNTAN